MFEFCFFEGAVVLDVDVEDAFLLDELGVGQKLQFLVEVQFADQEVAGQEVLQVLLPALLAGYSVAQDLEAGLLHAADLLETHRGLAQFVLDLRLDGLVVARREKVLEVPH